MPAFEWVHVQLHQQKGMISLSPPTICNSAVVFPSIEAAMRELKTLTNHVVVSGGGEIYKSLIAHADTLHISTIDSEPEGNVFFPEIPKEFNVVFEQEFHSNINYRYQIWQRG
ncbi:dihydrofolate reductase [Klebsiella pneumoniae]|nr:dihydrofolate reductase [Klebsiella pneumoniae]